MTKEEKLKLKQNLFDYIEGLNVRQRNHGYDCNGLIDMEIVYQISIYRYLIEKVEEELKLYD